MITDDKHWNILISNVLQMKRRDWTNSSDFVTIYNVYKAYITAYVIVWWNGIIIQQEILWVTLI